MISVHENCLLSIFWCRKFRISDWEDDQTSSDGSSHKIWWNHRCSLFYRPTMRPRYRLTYIAPHQSLSTLIQRVRRSHPMSLVVPCLLLCISSICIEFYHPVAGLWIPDTALNEAIPLSHRRITTRRRSLAILIRLRGLVRLRRSWESQTRKVDDGNLFFLFGEPCCCLLKLVKLIHM